MYNITNYTKKQAAKLGVNVRPSKNKGKKIDVYKDDKKMASVGSINYNDYPTYIKTKGKKYADERKKLYKIRHSTDRTKIGSNGWYADRLLW